MCSVEAATLAVLLQTRLEANVQRCGVKIGGLLQIDTKQRYNVGTASSSNLLNPRKTNWQGRGSTTGGAHRVNPQTQRQTQRQRVRRQKLRELGDGSASFVARLSATVPRLSSPNSLRRQRVHCHRRLAASTGSYSSETAR